MYYNYLNVYNIFIISYKLVLMKFVILNIEIYDHKMNLN